ncbi:hypothetical protein [Hymenobacter metallilatus]|uniref:Uncharacterized protein n=1 Tax=Hymenobacter metallilatus TaxID=2493666 RepID=A0A428JLJ8_9BACT|nr:hypothetical protein [Hymenobacter metallilatus]RSK33944.1 hypothetical protein EI290_09570 [Hymenobacter metallilatus]
MLVVLYSAFAALSGVVEAVLYSRRGAEAFSRNEHVEMVAQRLAVLLLVPAAIVTMQWSGSWWYVGAELVAAVLCFPMVHDEVYNFVRLWISWRERCKPDNPEADYIAWEMAWREFEYGYQSPTTTARNDFNGRTRTLLAIAGAVVEVVALYLVCHG